MASDPSDSAAPGNPPEDATRPGRRGQSRADLLEALAQVFGERGYDGATLALLASTTGLGKASLYHHFPGGKAEMAAALLRDAVARIESQAFIHLGGKGPAPERLAAFIDGFRAYVDDGARPCLIAVLSEGTSGETHGATIAAQFDSWSSRLAGTFEAAGLKPRRAERAATDLLANLYGHLRLARLQGEPARFKGEAKQLRKAVRKLG